MAAMISTKGSSPLFLLLSLVVSVILLPSLSHASDPGNLQDFCVADLKSDISVNGFPCKSASQVTSSDFFFDGLKMEGNTANIFGVNVTAGNVLSFPGLNTLGLSMNRVDFAPGGVNPLHSHPRATEAGVVIQGEILVGFISTRNVYYSKVLKSGEMFVIPKGLVHFQRNVGSGKALVVTSFNSQMPGAVILPTTIFAANPTLPNEVLTKSFQVDEKVISDIKSKFGS